MTRWAHLKVMQIKRLWKICASRETVGTLLITGLQPLLSHPCHEPSLQVLHGGIERWVVLLPLPDHTPFIKGSHKGWAHVILSNLNPAILLYPSGNGWVGSFDILCHMSLLQKRTPLCPARYLCALRLSQVL